MEEESNHFLFFYESDRLLRKGTNRKQKRQAADLECAFRAAAIAEASHHGFSPLVGPASVALHIYGLESGGNPQLPPVVKAYLDALRGITYVDDRQVEHLMSIRPLGTIHGWPAPLPLQMWKRKQQSSSRSRSSSSTPSAMTGHIATPGGVEGLLRGGEIGGPVPRST